MNELNDPVASATFVLAVVTFGLVVVTFQLVRLTRSSVDLSIRPLLADPSESADGEEEHLLFGPPMRISPLVPRGKLFYQASSPGSFHFSVALENLGAGVAAITGARTEPKFSGSVWVSRKFVPVGSIVRVNVAVNRSLQGSEPLDEHWWAMNGICVVVEYSDSNGGQRMVTKATIMQAATQGPSVKEISIFHRRTRLFRKEKHSLIASGKGSY